MHGNKIANQYTALQTHRDVSSTARLFNFSRPVYITNRVWHDCVEMIIHQGKMSDELAILQRLRHLLFMAASSVYGRMDDMEYDFCIYRIPNVSVAQGRKPEAVTLHLRAHKDEYDRPVITIKFPDE